MSYVTIHTRGCQFAEMESNVANPILKKNGSPVRGRAQFAKIIRSSSNHQEQNTCPSSIFKLGVHFERCVYAVCAWMTTRIAERPHDGCAFDATKS